MRGYFRTTKLKADKKLRAYIIGLAIGDGNLSKPGRIPRLRITCDKNYPVLLQRITNSLKSLLPDNKIGLVNRRGCIDVSVYSHHLETLLGWKADRGSKFVQNITIPTWIKEKDEYKIKCLKGLIETDGSIYSDRGYKMVNFVTTIPRLAKDVFAMISQLGFKTHLYKIPIKLKKTRYNIRLATKVEQFIKMIDLSKT